MKRFIFLSIIAVFLFGACNLANDDSGNVPEEPGAPSISVGDSQLSLTWTAIEDASAYEAWYSTTNDTSTASQDGGDIADTTYVIDGLTNNTTYYIWLKAKNDDGTSGFGSVASGTPVIAIPAAPDAPSVEAHDERLILSWTAVPGANSYEIWYSEVDDTGSAVFSGDDVGGTEFTLKDLTNGTTYYVWLKAKNSTGTSGFSPSASGIPEPMLVKPIYDSAPPTITSGESELDISWNPWTGAAAYEVWYSSDSDISTAVQSGGDITGTSHTITGLVNATTYNVWIRAKNAAGTTGFSEPGTGIPSDSTPPPIVEFVDITVNSGGIAITWTDPVDPDFIHANVQVDYISGGVSATTGPISIVRGIETFTQGVIDTDTKCTVTVTSEDLAGNESDPIVFSVNTTATGTIEYSAVNDVFDLSAIRNDLTENYLLITDIDIADTKYNTDWPPIGDDTSQFTGVFDGGGRVISELSIIVSDNYQGLFGYVGSTGTVRNIGLENIEITDPHSYVGGIAGRNDGTITDSYATGTITAVSAYGRVGGLVGENNEGEILDCHADVTISTGGQLGGLVGINIEGIIRRCYATGNVSGSNSIGGLVGSNASSFTDPEITECYATGNVSGSSLVGGLVGSLTGIVSNCFATGNVDGDDRAGGLAGSSSANVTNCFATGIVEDGIDDIGGLLGENAGTVSDSFWDTDTSTQDTSAGGTGKSSADMKDVDTFTDTATAGLSAAWDFDEDPNDDAGSEDIWSIDATINNEYPYLTDLESSFE